MRYSVVLPRVESTDAEGAREALGHAQELWTRGEQRAAIDEVRKAADAAKATGQKARALALHRAVTTLARAIGSSSLPPPMISEAPAVSAPRPKSRTGVSSSADTEPPAAPEAPRTGNVVPSRAPEHLSPTLKPSAPKRPSAASIGTMSKKASVQAEAATASLPPERRVTSPSLQSPLSHGAQSPIIAAAPITISEPAPEMEQPLAARSSTPAPDSSGQSPIDTASEQGELVVTIAPSDWALDSPNALVGHSAQRVAVAPGRGPGGTLMVRPLAPGEVAPKGSIVALMVALEPGAQPLPRTG